MDMINDDDEIAYAVEGEGDWGTEVGFVIRDNKVIYAGIDYLDYIKNGYNPDFEKLINGQNYSVVKAILNKYLDTRLI